MGRVTRPKEEGRIAIVTSVAGGGGRGHTGAKGSAGRVTVSIGLAHATGQIRVRQNRVVLAPGVCAPSLVVCHVQPDVHISHLQSDASAKVCLK